MDLAIEYLTRPVRHPQRLHHHDWIRSFSRIESFARLKYDYKVSKNQRSNKQSPFSCYYDSCVEEAVSGAALKVSFCFRTIRQRTEVLLFLLSLKGRDGPNEWLDASSPDLFSSFRGFTERTVQNTIFDLLEPEFKKRARMRTLCISCSIFLGVFDYAPTQYDYARAVVAGMRAMYGGFRLYIMLYSNLKFEFSGRVYTVRSSI